MLLPTRATCFTHAHTHRTQEVKEDEMLVLPGGGFTEDCDGTAGLVFSTPKLLGNMVEASKAWGESKARAPRRMQRMCMRIHACTCMHVPTSCVRMRRLRSRRPL